LRYFFHIGFLGTNYSGWQKNPDAISVQQVLEKSLSQIFRCNLWVVGCGRTDAQVHASQFFFHLDTDKIWEFDLIFRLNNVLPDDVAVFDIILMEGLPHARFDAIERSYDYFIHGYKDPFLSKLSSYYPTNGWNFNEMNKAAKLLLNYNDYHSFCKSPDRNTHTICHISAADLYVHQSGDKLRFRISANRFLGKMVRILMGKLIDIGSGKLSIDEFELFLANPSLVQVIKPAYPQGLYLSSIKYPYIDVPPRDTFSQLLSGNGGAWSKL
jgi:tRNA pseudouridine38-40 synthase